MRGVAKECLLATNRESNLARPQCQGTRIVAQRSLLEEPDTFSCGKEFAGLPRHSPGLLGFLLFVSDLILDTSTMQSQMCAQYDHVRSF